METVKLVFYRVYEPGEMQEPFIHEEGGVTLPMASVPRYKDRFTFGDKKYYAHDIDYAMNASNGSYTLTVSFYRKVSYAEFEGTI
jgi:hypothetical protein